MLIKYSKIVIVLFIINTAKGQTLKTKNTIVDSKTKIPLEYANISNKTDNTITNKDGQFIFLSKEKDINISHIGYETLHTTFEEIEKKDTIFMTANTIALDEVKINNPTTLLNEVYKNVWKIYPLEPYNEDLFLRCLLKKEDKIVRVQDISGKIWRNTFYPKKSIDEIKYGLEILNLRKVELSERKKIPYIQFPSYKTLFLWFSTIILKPKEYVFTEVPSNDLQYRKIEFVKNDENKDCLPEKGYYLIDKNEKAIKEVAYEIVEYYKNSPYSRGGSSKLKTTGLTLFIMFNKDIKKNKYYIGNAYLKNSFEIVTDQVKSNYEATYDLVTTNSFTNKIVKKNFPENKDLFKANFSYSEEFWSSQNQLPLTNELKQFLKSVVEKKNKTKEYEIIGNF
ncbi:hypothetical protein EOD40_02870 [Flavobacterium sufflavum]|uniref:Carboxypeptidase-like regulatory domain-containing protein n=1 Tax=Flavobacterium sufflavum TaxID=1921138 RepID=A0A3S3T057_9FLAO|nr:carboxypeptidase-like regulatory domain-containing protein [Flavobacterium sufflavum]RVT80071.1 hypothetical protein EOD40_02870 [Flavobacterium sufflavum]